MNYGMNLVMKPSSVCFVCNTQFNKSLHEVKLGLLFGIIYCDQCRKKAKQDIIDFINNNYFIPLWGVFGVKKVRFPRHNKLIEGEISVYNNRYIFGIQCVELESVKRFVLCVSFEDNTLCKDVPLEQLFIHNKNLYNTIIQADNLIKDKYINIKIGDLDINIQKKLENISKVD